MDTLEFLLTHRIWDPTCLRANVAQPEDIRICGTVKRAYVESNTLRPKGVDSLVRKAIEDIAPEWWGDETKIIVNRNLTCKRHTDHNDGHSWILWLGEFEGGALLFEDGTRIEEKRTWHKINGRTPHWSSSFASPLLVNNPLYTSARRNDAKYSEALNKSSGSSLRPTF